MEIVRPEEIHLASYTDALKRAMALGTIKIERAQGKLSEIAADPKSYLAKQEDPEALGGDIKLPDGTYILRIPGKTRYLWDGGGMRNYQFPLAGGNDGIASRIFGTHWV